MSLMRISRVVDPQVCQRYPMSAAALRAWQQPCDVPERWGTYSTTISAFLEGLTSSSRLTDHSPDTLTRGPGYSCTIVLKAIALLPHTILNLQLTAPVEVEGN
jgi:hypothetical protein